MLKVRREGDTVTASADAASCATLARRLDEALVRLACAAAGVARADATQVRAEVDGGDEPRRVLAWALPGGVTVTLRGEGIASGHGVHGERLAVAVSGLPPHVTLAAYASVDMRHGGSASVTLRGAPGLDELARQLGPDEP